MRLVQVAGDHLRYRLGELGEAAREFRFHPFDQPGEFAERGLRGHVTSPDWLHECRSSAGYRTNRPLRRFTIKDCKVERIRDTSLSSPLKCPAVGFPEIVVDSRTGGLPGSGPHSIGIGGTRRARQPKRCMRLRISQMWRRCSVGYRSPPKSLTVGSSKISRASSRPVSRDTGVTSIPISRCSLLNVAPPSLRGNHSLTRIRLIRSSKADGVIVVCRPRATVHEYTRTAPGMVELRLLAYELSVDRSEE